jgi:hypothetical protein
LGAWASLLLAMRLHIIDFELLGDSKVVIDWLNSKGHLQVSSLLGWMDRTRELQHKFRHITHLHTPRENNKNTDALSKTSLQKQVGLLSYNHWLENHEGPTININYFYFMIVFGSMPVSIVFEYHFLFLPLYLHMRLNDLGLM